MKKLTTTLLLAVFGCIMRVAAVCVYNAAENAIWIYDYQEDLPARPKNLLFFEQINDWGLITHDITNDTYIINANLWIGRNDGSDTFFQLGAPDHPHETLILNGNLVVYPARIAGENQPGYTPGINQFTIGMPDRPDIRARLLFQQAPNQRHTLHSGAYYKGTKMTGVASTSGRLHVYHGTISAADAARPVAPNLYMYLAEVVLRHATISRISGTMAYGAQDGPYTRFQVENTVFEHGGNVAAWGDLNMRGATFRGLHVALGTANIPLKAHLTECRFVDNNANWELRPCGGTIYLDDCEINPPLQTNRYPACVANMPVTRVLSSRHIRLKAVDAKGAPRAGVRVEALAGSQRVRSLTGKDGLTPGPGAPDALLLDEWEETPGPMANAPVHRKFSWLLRAVAPDGVTAEIADFQPTQSWAIVELTLK